MGGLAVSADQILIHPAPTWRSTLA
jgi:hypothetical protein